ncbi:Diaminopimelate epimerase-like protein [Dendrothele bispora CBS 962.96]|uniref:trans-L-3-hydroxyproline dehydratase n=1 Tax=Dendrothele bispora (strain CBS 962.96) TaxID=1314807 RepID=A0A4S8MX94_DENBC|nr:Diaminopimelate epimerase-like protein [Dendrothele bispora CBS 962.96]
MDLFEDFSKDNQKAIKVIDMHTSGEPTRIVVSGYPSLDGKTLLEKRRWASERHDDIRKMLMLEPRGHDGMYGAVLVQETELTKSGEADIGVLFCHNQGYSTMCGHATIALGRFLVDTQDLQLFPKRNQVEVVDSGTITKIRLHAPCGVVHISVPTITTKSGRRLSDGSKPVSFISVPSFVSRRSFAVDIPAELAWRQLRLHGSATEEQTYIVNVDICYGGAFYNIVSAQELGFSDGLRGESYTMKDFADASQKLESLLKTRKDLYQHPREKDLEFSYGVMIVDKTFGSKSTGRGEVGLLFFAEGQIDRSPTGSCVSARVALGVDQGWLEVGTSEDNCVPHEGNGFRGRAVKRVQEGIVVEVDGRAHYTSAASFILPDFERDDVIGRGFKLELPYYAKQS